MKRFIKLSLVCVAVFCTQSMMAQQKFGYINSQEVLMQMPEIETINTNIEQLSKDYSDMLDNMQVELNTKIQEYQKNLSSYTAAIKQVKEREMQELQGRLEEFYGTAQQEINDKRQELIAPVVEKARNAIQKIARENNFFVVFDQAAGATVYLNEKDPNMIDITPMVKKELGIKEAAK